MKILKKIGIVLLVLIAIWLVVSLFLPSNIRIARSTVIQAPAAAVFNTVNNMHTWKDWSYWDRIDPNMDSRFEGPETGAGSIHYWSSKNDSVGTGSLKITESTPNTALKTELSFEGMGSSMGGWDFEESAEGIKATIYMNIDVGFTGRVIPGLILDKFIGKDFEKTLAGLKNYVETLPAPVAASWKIETVTTTTADGLSMRVTCKRDEMQSKIGEMYGALEAEVAKQGLKINGPAYTIYHVWAPPDTIDMEAGMITDKAGKSAGNIMAAKLMPQKAIRLDYYGNYDKLGDAHMFIDEYIKQNNLTITGAPWEEYYASPKTEPDTAKWMTKIYYPVN